MTPQPRAGSPAGAAVVWNPVPGAGHEEARAEARRARRRGLLQALVAGGFALLLFFFWSRIVSGVVASVAVALLASSWLSPTGLYARVEAGFETFGRWTGEFLSFVSLTIVFYSIFLPFGLLFRRGSRDPLKRHYDPDATSYWEPREPAAADAQRRQF